MEITVTINAPDLAQAITRLADALQQRTAPQVETEPVETVVPTAGTPESTAAEKPKRKRAAKPEPAAAPESSQAAPTAPEAQSPANVTPEPEKPAEAPQSATEPTLDQIAAAGAKLLDDDSTKMSELLALLRDFGVQAITQLRQEQLGAFADRLRLLGAGV